MLGGAFTLFSMVIVFLLTVSHSVPSQCTLFSLAHSKSQGCMHGCMERVAGEGVESVQGVDARGKRSQGARVGKRHAWHCVQRDGLIMGGFQWSSDRIYTPFHIYLAPQMAEFGFALWAFVDIQRAEPTGLRYYYMFKLASLLMSLLLFILTSYWTSPEVRPASHHPRACVLCLWQRLKRQCRFSTCLSRCLSPSTASGASGHFTRHSCSEGRPLPRRDSRKRTSRRGNTWLRTATGGATRCLCNKTDWRARRARRNSRRCESLQARFLQP